VIKTIDTYDFSAQPSINEALIRELLRGEYLDKRETCYSSGTPELVKPILSLPWPFQPVPKVGPFASIPLPTWSLSSWSAGKKNDFSECTNSFRDSICWSSMNWDMFLSPKQELNYSLRSSVGPTSIIASWSPTNLAFEEWTEIFGSEGSPVRCLIGSLTDAISWKRMEKAID